MTISQGLDIASCCLRELMISKRKGQGLRGMLCRSYIECQGYMLNQDPQFYSLITLCSNKFLLEMFQIWLLGDLIFLDFFSFKFIVERGIL